MLSSAIDSAPALASAHRSSPRPFDGDAPTLASAGLFWMARPAEVTNKAKRLIDGGWVASFEAGAATSMVARPGSGNGSSISSCIHLSELLQVQLRGKMKCRAGVAAHGCRKRVQNLRQGFMGRVVKTDRRARDNTRSQVGRVPVGRNLRVGVLMAP